MNFDEFLLRSIFKILLYSGNRAFTENDSNIGYDEHMLPTANFAEVIPEDDITGHSNSHDHNCNQIYYIFLCHKKIQLKKFMLMLKIQVEFILCIIQFLNILCFNPSLHVPLKRSR